MNILIVVVSLLTFFQKLVGDLKVNEILPESDDEVLAGTFYKNSRMSSFIRMS
jgi:hypothetical protein